MEVIIDSISMVGFSKVYKAFRKQIGGYYVNNTTDKMNVILVNNSSWKIDTFSWGICITDEKNNITITLASKEFNKIIIQ